jgi:hypothetical protein
MIRYLVASLLVGVVLTSSARASDADAGSPGEDAKEKPAVSAPKTRRLTDSEVKARLVQESKASYRAKLQRRGKAGTCPCPDDTARDGSRCGGRSAYIRPGGEKPLCGPEDVTDGMVLDYRNAHREVDRAASPQSAVVRLHLDIAALELRGRERLSPGELSGARFRVTE